MFVWLHGPSFWIPVRDCTPFSPLCVLPEKKSHEAQNWRESCCELWENWGEKVKVTSQHINVSLCLLSGLLVLTSGYALLPIPFLACFTFLLFSHFLSLIYATSLVHRRPPPTRWGIQYLLVAKLQYATANGGITVRWGPGHAFQEIFKLLVWSKKKERNINVILTWRAGGRFPVQSAPWLFANCAITFSLAAILQSSSFPTLLRLVPPLRKFSEIAYPSVEKCSLYRVCADYDTPKPTEICRKA